MSYGPDLIDLWRRGAVYIDKILKGAKPAELPVEQASKFQLVIISRPRVRSASDPAVHHCARDESSSRYCRCQSGCPTAG